MKKAEIPSNESERIADLYSYRLLDTDAEIAYDEITHLASQICGVPIALISIVDKNRQWFKSKVGLDAKETPRDVSFCGHAIHEEELFIVENALEDERFADNPLVIDGPKVIFYAGAQIKSGDGNNLGTLCVIDHTPQSLDENQQKSLKILANQVSRLLELRKNNFRLTELVQQVKESQNEAIHQAKLVSLGKLAGGISHEINNPMTIISGRTEQLKIRMEKKHDENSKELKLLSSIHENVKRIKEIIWGMLEFSRDEKASKIEVIDARDAINLTLKYFKEKCRRYNVVLEENLEVECQISVNKIQVSQIITNLFNNAFEATDGLSERKISVSATKDSDFCYIAITDNGTGLTKEIANKIFEPFFTTKSTGKGTGLGLSISMGLARRNTGQLFVDTEVESGARFVIKFPLV